MSSRVLVVALLALAACGRSAASEPQGDLTEASETPARRASASLQAGSRVRARADSEIADVGAEPLHEGKSLADWLSLLDDDSVSFWTVLDAVQALGQAAIDQVYADFESQPESDLRFEHAKRIVIGLVAEDEARNLPRMLSLASEGTGVVRARALDVLACAAWDADGQAPLVLARLGPLLRDPDPATRRLTLHALERLDGDADSVADAVHALFTDPNPEVRAAVLATKLRKAAWWDETVLHALSDSESVVRLAACEELRRGPSRADATVAALLKALNDPDEAVRAAAADPLSRCAGAKSDAVAALVRLADEQSDHVRCCALRALQHLDRGADVPLERLGAILRDPGNAQWAALDVLAQHGTRAASAVAVVLPFLRSENKYERASAVKAVVAAAPPADAATAIQPLVDDVDDYVRQIVAEELAKCGAAGATALCRALGDPSESVRRAAVMSLDKLGADATASLTCLLDDPNPRRRETALGLLADSAAATTAERAEQLLGDADAGVRRAAANLIGHSAAASSAHASSLATRLTDSDENVRFAAAQALSNVDPLPDTIAKALHAALRDKDAWVRSAAATSLLLCDERAALAVLARLAPDGKVSLLGLGRLAHVAATKNSRGALDVLVSALRGPDECLRYQAAEFLGEIPGATSAPALPALLDVVADKSPPTERCPDGQHSARCEALRALHLIAPSDPRVQAALHAAAEGDDDWMRRTARKALGLEDEDGGE